MYVRNFYLQIFSNEKYASWFRQSENARSTRYTEQNRMYVLQILTEHSKQYIKSRGLTLWKDTGLKI